MAPPKLACELLTGIMKPAAKAVIAAEKIGKLIQDIITTKAKIKWFMVLDLIGAEVTALIGSVANSLAAAALGAASAAANALMTQVFNALLQCLLGAPTAIFSLVSIPQEYAMKKCNEERIKLASARDHLTLILSIFAKWLGGSDKTKFVVQIEKAMPIIQKAIEKCIKIRDQLDAKDPYFDELTYERLRTDIKNAINITNPQSNINNIARYTQSLESDRQKRKSAKMVEINAWYLRAKKAVDKARSDKLIPIYNRISEAEKRYRENPEYDSPVVSISGVNGAAAINQTRYKHDKMMAQTDVEAANNQWDLDIKGINLQKQVKLAKADFDAQAESIRGMGDVIAKATNNLIDQFNFDMTQIGNLTVEFVQDIRDAYIAYTAYHIGCNTIYNFQGIIRLLIKKIIELLNATGIAAAEALKPQFDIVKAMLQTVYERFDKADKRFRSGDGVSAMELSGEVNIGNGILIASDNILEATVVKPLRDLVNSDELMKDASGKYDTFISDLAGIPDWDNKKNVWAVDLVNGAQDPYIQLVADSVTAAAQSVSLPFSGESGRAQFNVIITRVNDAFKPLMEHNALCYNVLGSYVPYNSVAAADLKRILKAAGCFESFAMLMNLTALITSVKTMVAAADISDLFGTEIATPSSCFAAYSEMFDDDMLKVFSLHKTSIPPVEVSTAQMAKIEEAIPKLNYIKTQAHALSTSLLYYDIVNGSSIEDVKMGKQ